MEPARAAELKRVSRRISDYSAAAPGAGPARGDRPAAPDQAHRRADDGEPFLRQLPGHADRPGRGVPARPGDKARRIRPRGAGRIRPGAPPGQHGPGSPTRRRRAGTPPTCSGRTASSTGLSPRPSSSCRTRTPRGPSGYWTERDLPFYFYGLAQASAGGPLVLLLPGAHLPQPPVPDLRDRQRAHRRPAVQPGRLPAEHGTIFDLLSRHEHLVGELPPAGRRAVRAPVGCCSTGAGWSRRRLRSARARWIPAGRHARSGKDMQFTADIYPLGPRPVHAARARHRAVLRRRRPRARCPRSASSTRTSTAYSEENPQDIQQGRELRRRGDQPGHARHGRGRTPC